jgi:hypothetical protein
MASNVLDRINFSNIDGRYTNCCKLAVGGASAGLGRDASLGFLDHDSPILVLPVPYDKDFIDVDCNALGYGGGFLQMAAFSGEEVVSCRLALNKTEEMRCKDLRQKEESNKAFIRSKVVSKVSQSNPLELNTHEYAVLDSVEKLFDTIKTISSVGNVLASEFDFLKTWSTLSLEEKLKLHEKKVCHEFNLWLKKKDASFFDSYVQPALKVKTSAVNDTNQ